MNGSSLPLIFDIHRFALHDGPGIRTTVFLKGCPLSCVWCHNPESIGKAPQIAVYPSRCVRCGACKDICPEGLISVDSHVEIDRGLCTACGKCADGCPATALRRVGETWSVEKLLELVMRDKHFFDASGGGVTVSGGEPTLWTAYLEDLLKGLKARQVHTAIQTCGMFDPDGFFQRILPYVDLVMYDLKLMDAAEHKKYTGRSNRRILENFVRLTREAGDRVLPRVPLVPGITATRDNLPGIASFLSDLGYDRSCLLSFNPGGVDKRRIMGMEPALRLSRAAFDTGEEQSLRDLFNNRLIRHLHTAA